MGPSPSVQNPVTSNKMAVTFENLISGLVQMFKIM